jgi:hypothetical protein
MNIIQAKLIAMGLDMEITSMARGSKMQMTREPAMKTLERLTGIDAYATFGKGIKGRENAFQWLQETLELNGEEPVKRLTREPRDDSKDFKGWK